MAKKMQIPPPVPEEYGPYEVKSGTTDPHLAGPLEVRLTAVGGWIRWMGEDKWQQFYWHELAILSGAHGEYKQVLEDLRVQAFEEGMTDGVEHSYKHMTLKKTDEQAVLNYRDELKEFQKRGGNIDEPLKGA